ncbi:MAG: hypothetical protein J6X06_00875 [Elusimicrobiaceae bacterium]|nr:hypothetical protein [Elusimicrobiaceae bacterium]
MNKLQKGCVALSSFIVLVGFSPAFGQTPRVPRNVIRTTTSAKINKFVEKKVRHENTRRGIAEHKVNRQAIRQANANRGARVGVSATRVSHAEIAQKHLDLARERYHRTNPLFEMNRYNREQALYHAQEALNEALSAEFSEKQLTVYKEMLDKITKDITAQATRELERAQITKDPVEAWDHASSALELAETANMSPIHLIPYENVLKQTQKAVAENFLKEAQKWIEEKPFLSLSYAEFAQSLAQEAGCTAEELAAYEEILKKAQEETDIIEIEDAITERHAAQVSSATRIEKEVNNAEREILKKEASKRKDTAREQHREQYYKVSDLRDQWRNASTKDRPAIAQEWQKQAQILEEQYPHRAEEILVQQANEAVAISSSEIKAQQRAQKFADMSNQMIEELNQMQAHYNTMPAMGEKDIEFAHYIGEAKKLPWCIHQRMNAKHPTAEEFAEVEEYTAQLKHHLNRAKIIYQEKISFAEKIAEQERLEGKGAEEAAAGADKAMEGKQFTSVEQYVNELLEYYDELDLTQP